MIKYCEPHVLIHDGNTHSVPKTPVFQRRGKILVMCVQARKLVIITSPARGQHFTTKKKTKTELANDRFYILLQSARQRQAFGPERF